MTRIICVYWFFPLLLFLQPHPILGQTVGTLFITEDTTLAQDHLGNIIMATEGVTLDCDGHAIMGPSPGPGNTGISVRSSEVTVQNCYVTNFGTGFALPPGSENNILQGNTAFDNTSGFNFNQSKDNVIRNNTANNNFVGFLLAASSGNTLTRNTANNNTNGFVLQFISAPNTLTNNTANNNLNCGFDLTSILEHTLTANTANNNTEGFRIRGDGRENTFKNNTAHDNGVNGFVIDGLGENIYTGNKACGNGAFDAIQDVNSIENVFAANEFCTTKGF